ncbi:MAG: metallophosphoesterase family protein [Bacteroidota bacterium]
MRTLVVGDIHSGLRALKEVLEKVNPAPGDRFIFLGDYVDGWSDAAPTVSFLIEFSKKYPCTFIRGNHDYLMYKYLKQDDENPMWLAHGGQASKESYDVITSEEKNQHITFYEDLQNYYIDDRNRLFVHAGFTNLSGPRYEYFEDLVFWDRTLWETARSLDPDLTQDDIHYPQRLKLFNEIYIGHTPVTRIGATQPVNFANLWNVDTGAAFKGPLTIMDADSKEFWQSTPVHLLYPDENGRN